MATTHYEYNSMKIPTKGRVVTIRTDLRTLSSVWSRYIGKLWWRFPRLTRFEQFGPVTLMEYASNRGPRPYQEGTTPQRRGRPITIGSGHRQIGKRILTFIWENSNLFAWDPSGLPDIPREVIEHHLEVCRDITR